MKRIRFGILAIAAAACACTPGVGVEPGMMAPDATVQNMLKDPVTISSMKGKVVLLDFWATWCGPCRHTMPTLQRIYNDYRGKGVEIMGVTREPQHIIGEFLKGSQFTYPMYTDNTGAANSAYKIESIPVLVVIGKNGQIVTKHIGAPLNDKGLRASIDAELQK